MCWNKILKYLRNLFVLGYTAASLGEWILVFRRIIVPSHSSVEMSEKSDIQTLEDDGNTILGNRLPSDAATQKSYRNTCLTHINLYILIYYHRHGTSV
jgi:hypothetical protein